MQGGFLKFAVKDAPRSRNKEYQITQETLSLFTEQLKTLILQICNPEMPFIEKEID